MTSTTTPDKDLLTRLSSTPLDTPIPADLLATALSAPPFAPSIPGSLNLRDVGALFPSHVRPGAAFRSGTLDNRAEQGQHLSSLLRSRLGVSRVYDFRRADEKGRQRSGAAGGEEEEEEEEVVEVLACPYMDGAEVPRPVVVGDFAAGEGGVLGVGYRDMYDDILRGYRTGFRMVFEGLRTVAEGEAVLFHCTGGKDRTGVMSALILDLMGVPAEQIAQEYALTRIGTEPFREMLLPIVLKAYGAGAAVAGGGGAADLNTPGMREFLSTDAAVMVDFVGRLRREHGGAEGYLRDSLGFSEKEVAQIRERLRPKGGEGAGGL
ncbi:protein-tyrosine phosphatase [Phialemonium atrogriseum]|uniref:Protein-tyrosine phosphatase n=1 Tax=Phialemonium atrogriseum TaxID=1093897 RepID=A0AAJ0FJK5_9PEZI|nr:protein-tyrosine phosphatase [Phialemonium atrogriseum]KAK1770726.1 protein-tyrosine phosphatase [Phialemonium atrogriseum]